MTQILDSNDSPDISRRNPRFGAWLLMAPMLLWLLLFVVAPTAIMLVYSFCTRDNIGQVQLNFTLENYARLFEKQYFAHFAYSLLGGLFTFGAAALVLPFLRRYFPYRWGDAEFEWWRIAILCFVVGTFLVFNNEVDDVPGYFKTLWVSMRYAFWSTMICVVAGYPVAYFIGRAPERTRNLLLMFVMIPFWTNFLIRTYAWIIILSENGLLSGALQWMNVISAPLPILSTPTAVMIGLVYTYLPFMILPIYGSVEKLDNSLVEAAFDLGAGPVRAFSNVIVPMTKPGIAAGFLLVFIPAVGMFAITDVLGGKSQVLIGNVIENQFRRANNAPFGSALGIALLVLFVVTFWLASNRGRKAAAE